jgi:branched-chain amino acid transport system ATP-binding protein
MLRLSGVTAGYGANQILNDLTLDMADEPLVALLGRNGVGKSTTLNSVFGLLKFWKGTVTFDGVEINGLASHAVAKMGVGYVPQGRRIFPEFTVAENLMIGVSDKRTADSQREWVFDLFPRLRERLTQLGGSLSGGEQQMLAIGRALLPKPRLVLMDEPVEGLSPQMASTVRNAIIKMREAGIRILLVEQSVENALLLADEINFMEKGQIKARSAAAKARTQPELFERYLGVRPRTISAN